MATYRKVVLANEQIYHIFNRGIDRKTIFTTKWEYKRAIETFKFYQFADLPFKFSQILKLSEEDRTKALMDIHKNNDKLVDIIAFCLMPNHFHFILKQLKDNGISRFVSNFTNSYSKYFNTKHERFGHLFEGLFKTVLVEDDEQLIHLSRYIHLNPTSSFIIKTDQLENYEWSSLPEYLGISDKNICQKNIVVGYFQSMKKYKQFVLDQVRYAQELDKIKHLLIE